LHDSWIVKDLLEAIPLFSRETGEIGISGGEPTLLGDNLIKILRSLQGHLLNTAVHILSNGRAFQRLKLAEQVAEVGSLDLMIGIPIYSDVGYLHDYVIQAEGAFDETIRGIINLKRCNAKLS
jgi:MoaA/NifB/PqqE/SkfB family radical SAM enzyme